MVGFDGCNGVFAVNEWSEGFGHDHLNRPVGELLQDSSANELVGVDGKPGELHIVEWIQGVHEFIWRKVVCVGVGKEESCPVARIKTFSSHLVPSVWPQVELEHSIDQCAGSRADVFSAVFSGINAHTAV